MHMLIAPNRRLGMALEVGTNDHSSLIASGITLIQA